MVTEDKAMAIIYATRKTVPELLDVINLLREEKVELEAENRALRRRLAQLQAVEAWCSTDPHSEQETVAR